MLAGACFGAIKTDVVRFSLERILETMAVPGICGNGHLLALDNLKVDDAKRRWCCRRCGRARAAEFRARHKPADVLLGLALTTELYEREICFID